jgi:VanZ family protein
MRLTMEKIGLSLTKVPHVVLFGFFFLVTAAQFDRIDRRTLAWSGLATLVMGLLVELEEGATRTGNCRLTDVLPDILGALIVGAVLVSIMTIRRRVP